MNEEEKIEQREMIELTKNTKGYNWRIKVLGNPLVSEETIKVLEDLDKELKEKFGNE